MVTVTPGTTARWSSMALTRMEPDWICARAGRAVAPTIAITASNTAPLLYMLPPTGVRYDRRRAEDTAVAARTQVCGDGCGDGLLAQLQTSNSQPLTPNFQTAPISQSRIANPGGLEVGVW